MEGAVATDTLEGEMNLLAASCELVDRLLIVVVEVVGFKVATDHCDITFTSWVTKAAALSVESRGVIGEVGV